MTLNLEEEASKVVMKINTNKTKIVSLTGYRTFPTCINGGTSRGLNSLYFKITAFLPNLAPSLMSLDASSALNTLLLLVQNLEMQLLQHQHQVEAIQFLCFLCISS